LRVGWARCRQGEAAELLGELRAGPCRSPLASISTPLRVRSATGSSGCLIWAATLLPGALEQIRCACRPSPALAIRV